MAASWQGGGKEGELSTAPLPEQCACAKRAAWEQVWVKESGPVSAPHREGDTAHGLESVAGGLADRAGFARYHLGKTRKNNVEKLERKSVLRIYYLDKTSLLSLALRGPLAPLRPPRERPPKETRLDQFLLIRDAPWSSEKIDNGYFFLWPPLLDFNLWRLRTLSSVDTVRLGSRPRVIISWFFCLFFKVTLTRLFVASFLAVGFLFLFDCFIKILRSYLFICVSPARFCNDNGLTEDRYRARLLTRRVYSGVQNNPIHRRTLV